MLRLSPHRLCCDVCPWQGGKKEQLFLDMYNDAMDGMEQRLLKRIQGSNVHMLSDWTGTLNPQRWHGAGVQEVAALAGGEGARVQLLADVRAAAVRPQPRVRRVHRVLQPAPVVQQAGE